MVTWSELGRAGYGTEHARIRDGNNVIEMVNLASVSHDIFTCISAVYYVGRWLGIRKYESQNRFFNSEVLWMVCIIYVI